MKQTSKKSCNCNCADPCMCTTPDIPETAVPAKRVQIVGNAFVVTSKLPFEIIKKLEKYASNTLCLKERDHDEEKEYFRIATGKVSSISKYGITFNEANKDGFAIATALFPEKISNKKRFIKDEFGKTLYMLQDVEQNATHAYAHFEKAYAELDSIIEEI